MNKIELKEIYCKLSNDDSDLANKKAKEYISSAISQIDNYKKLFIFMGGISILLYFFLAVGLYIIIKQPKTFNYITNQKTRQIIIRRETPAAQKAKAKFISKKISLLNPKAEAGKLGTMIAAAGHKYDIDPFFIGSMIHHESNFNSNAVSDAGAIGLMQVMPDTGKFIFGVDTKTLYDPFSNIETGTKYFKMLLIKFNFNIMTALVAYNAGPTIVSNHGIKTLRKSFKYATNINATNSSWKKEYNG